MNDHRELMLDDAHYDAQMQRLDTVESAETMAAPFADLSDAEVALVYETTPASAVRKTAAAILIGRGHTAMQLIGLRPHTLEAIIARQSA